MEDHSNHILYCKRKFWLCVGQNSCNISFISRNYPMTIEIPFVCKAESNMIDIYKPVSNCRVPYLDLYLSGDEHHGENLNCDCTVSISNTSLPVYLYVYFINLSVSSCGNVSITCNGQYILNCSNSGLQSLSQSMGAIDGEFKIQMTNLVVDGGDMMYLTLGGRGDCAMDVKCSGCDDSISIETSTFNPDEVTTEYKITYESSQLGERTTNEYIHIDNCTTEIPYKGDNTFLLSLEGTSTIEITTEKSNTTDRFSTVEITTEKSNSTDHISSIEVTTVKSNTTDRFSTVELTTVKSNTTDDTGDDHNNESIDKYIIYGILAALLVIIVVVVLSGLCHSRYKSQEVMQEDGVFFTRIDSRHPEVIPLSYTNYSYIGEGEQISQT
ncbi:hypothetical protein LOTGIDRAFT_162800 [Lottia gigantea]|uniref:Uncharacterized protein n=1 Tax=Lottia gigantea TaxID=225164 RepID=V4BSU8_LOTGI|nr:hypothetical protein LOTGIDRAFT_162800 [Lottia gigantea]ESO92149.1 hypothetical protein LOTGIDRAFT_162800 [Lottia gigantea]